MRNTASIFLMSLVAVCATGGGGMCYAEDCNSNGIDDTIDISSNGDSNDCNTNSIPDECDLISGAGTDCNSNYLLDSCDVDWGASEDVNTNGVPDECELPSGPQSDCNNNGISDSCDLDCGEPGDACYSVAGCGESPDCNGNGTPDECDILFEVSSDCNQDGIPDECYPVDVVFLIDTSGSVQLEAQQVCDNISEIVDLLSQSNLKPYPDYYAILDHEDNSQIPCLSDWGYNLVSNLDSGPVCNDACGPINDNYEDNQSWGSAISILAEHYPWSSTHARVIVAISDEGPCRGDAETPVCNQYDESSTETAIKTSINNNVLVFPLITADLCVEQLADSVGLMTGGKHFAELEDSETVGDCIQEHVHAHIDAIWDCNENEVFDICEMSASDDCDSNDIMDACEADCNANSVTDACDISLGTSSDIDGDGVPDECQDCNANGVLDSIDIYPNQTSSDVNCNNIPDECETRLYVNQNASPAPVFQYGTSWEQPFLELKVALWVAQIMPYVEEIWVAAGEYYPGETYLASFEILDDLKIYGGFEGYETSVNYRDWRTFETIISGDYNETPSNPNDDVQVILSVDPNGDGCSVLIDGVILQNADIGIRGIQPTLEVYNTTLRDCTQNAISLGPEASSQPCSFLLSNCLLTDNGDDGSAFRCLSYNTVDYNLTFESSVFSGNSTTGDGAAVNLQGVHSAVFNNCEFTENNATSEYQYGGAICSFNSPVSLLDCRFLNNSVDYFGGGIFLQNGSIHADRCVFADNSCSDGASGGGAIYAYVDSSDIANSLFVGNQAAFGGAVGLYLNQNINQNETFHFVNNTVVYNNATVAAGGYEISGDQDTDNIADVLIENVILWGNSAPTGAQVGNYNSNHPDMAIYNSDVQNSTSGIAYPSPFSWVDNINEEPLFALDTGTFSGDYHLTSLSGNCSPCIDEGDNSLLLPAYPYDLDVITRVLNGCSFTGNPIVDMGAYEFWDCNANGISDPTEPVLSSDADNDLDLADFAVFQDCVLETDQEKIPNCLIFFDRAPSVSDSSCGSIDAYDLLFFVAQMTGPDTQGFGAMASMMAPLASSETAEDGADTVIEPDPWTIQEGDLAITIKPLSGGRAVTTLAPNTSYVMKYRSGYVATDFVLVVFAASSEQGLASARIPESGDWAACTAFSCLDMQTLQVDLDEPGEDGLRQTDVVTGTLPVVCSTSGQLCFFKTGNAGTLRLNVEMARIDGTSNTISIAHREIIVDVVSN